MITDVGLAQGYYVMNAFSISVGIMASRERLEPARYFRFGNLGKTEFAEPLKEAGSLEVCDSQ